MGELTEEALQSGSEGPDGGDEPRSKSKKRLVIADQNAWIEAFLEYAGVVCRRYPEKAPALLSHMRVVLSCKDRSTSGVVEDLQ